MAMGLTQNTDAALQTQPPSGPKSSEITILLNQDDHRVKAILTQQKFGKLNFN